MSPLAVLSRLLDAARRCERSAWHPRRLGALGAVLVAGLLGMRLFVDRSSAGFGGEPVAPQSAIWLPPGSSIQDCRLEILARQVLAQDEKLGDYNLGVSVRSNVATLWGAVPAAPLIDRAVDKVRAVPGIAEVRCEMRVEVPRRDDADDPASHSVHRQPAPLPTWGELAGLSADPAPVNRSLRASPSARQRPAEELPTVPPLVIPSISAAPAAPEPNREERVRSQKLVDQIEQLRRKDPRFWTIRVDLDGRMARLSGSAPRASDFFELAQLISQVAGIERVVIEKTDGPIPSAK